jgi:RNA polymerase sporulation-specific sigma factor
VYVEDVLGSDDEGNEITIGDLSYSEEDSVEMIAECDDVSARLDDILKKNLTDREYKIMCMRYGLRGGVMMPQREVAVELGISRSYISRLEKKAIEIIRERLNPKDYGC